VPRPGAIICQVARVRRDRHGDRSLPRHERFGRAAARLSDRAAEVRARGKKNYAARNLI